MKLKRLGVVAITVGLLAGGAGGAAAQGDESTSNIEAFRTTEVETGVLRVLDDNAGHDLTRKWPRKRRDIDHIAVSPSGQVWLSITASGPDNSRLRGAQLWPLGSEATYGPKTGAGNHHGRLLFDEEGRLWVIGSRMAIFDGEEWSSSKPGSAVTATDGTIWLASHGVGVESFDGTELTPHLEGIPTGQVFAGPDGTVGAETWGGLYLYDGEEWTRTDGSRRRAVSSDGTLGVLLNGRNGMRLYRDGESVVVLKGNGLNEVAAAPDGTLWLAGGVGQGNGGVYRVDPAQVFAARAEADPAQEAGADG